MKQKTSDEIIKVRKCSEEGYYFKLSFEGGKGYRLYKIYDCSVDGEVFKCQLILKNKNKFHTVLLFKKIKTKSEA